MCELTPTKRINQFPYENVITVKDLLSIVSRRTKDEGHGMLDDVLESNPRWLPITFNLKTEIPKFVSYYQQREKK